jgi:hypothetical protein
VLAIYCGVRTLTRLLSCNLLFGLLCILINPFSRKYHLKYPDKWHRYPVHRGCRKRADASRPCLFRAKSTKIVAAAGRQVELARHQPKAYIFTRLSNGQSGNETTYVHLEVPIHQDSDEMAPRRIQGRNERCRGRRHVWLGAPITLPPDASPFITNVDNSSTHVL